MTSKIDIPERFKHHWLLKDFDKIPYKMAASAFELSALDYIEEFGCDETGEEFKQFGTSVAGLAFESACKNFSSHYKPAKEPRALTHRFFQTCSLGICADRKEKVKEWIDAEWDPFFATPEIEEWDLYILEKMTRAWYCLFTGYSLKKVPEYVENLREKQKEGEEKYLLQSPKEFQRARASLLLCLYFFAAATESVGHKLLSQKPKISYEDHFKSAIKSAPLSGSFELETSLRWLFAASRVLLQRKDS